MARKKVTLTWIDNNSARRATLKKRRQGLVKKVTELSTLCGTDSCLVIYSPEETEPIVWPSYEEVQRQLGLFYQVPELESIKKKMNLESYTKERLSKSQEQLGKMKKKNKEVEVGALMLQIHNGVLMINFNMNQLRELAWFMENRLSDFRKCIEYYKRVHVSSAGPAQGDVPSVPQPQGYAAGHDIGGASTANASVGDDERVNADTESLLWDNWFHDITNTNNFRGETTGSSVRSDMGLTYYNTFASTAAENMGLHEQYSIGDTNNPSIAPHDHLGIQFQGPSYGGISTIAQPSRPSFVGGSSSSVVANDPVLPGGSSFGGSSSAAPQHELAPFNTYFSPFGGNFSPFGGHDMGPGHYPFGPLGSDFPINEFGDYPFGFFGGESSSGNDATGGSSGAAGSSEMRPFGDEHGPNNP